MKKATEKNLLIQFNYIKIEKNFMHSPKNLFAVFEVVKLAWIRDKMDLV